MLVLKETMLWSEGDDAVVDGGDRPSITKIQKILVNLLSTYVVGGDSKQRTHLNSTWTRAFPSLNPSLSLFPFHWLSFLVPVVSTPVWIGNIEG